MGDPNSSEAIRKAEGVGDAHSSEDRQDNITCQERRGITVREA